jgi:hypothetical protein
LPQGQQTMWRKNGRQHHHAEYILGLRGNEWVIFGVKA